MFPLQTGRRVAFEYVYLSNTRAMFIFGWWMGLPKFCYPCKISFSNWDYYFRKPLQGVVFINYVQNYEKPWTCSNFSWWIVMTGINVRFINVSNSVSHKCPNTSLRRGCVTMMKKLWNCHWYEFHGLSRPHVPFIHNIDSTTAVTQLLLQFCTKPSTYTSSIPTADQYNDYNIHKR